MIYFVDIDGTICTDTGGDYAAATPIQEAIDRVNSLHDQGHEIIYWTARGTTSGIDYAELTREQLHAWGVRYSELRFGKPEYDKWVDDKAEALT